MRESVTAESAEGAERCLWVFTAESAECAERCL